VTTPTGAEPAPRDAAVYISGGTKGPPRTRLRDRHPGSSFAHLLFYELCRKAARLALAIFYRIKPVGLHRVPATGPLLIVANHQSFLDPPIVSAFLTHRHTDFIARAGLFKFRPFAWLIGSLNSIPIAEAGGDTAAMKEALKRLGEGKAVLIFPEGSRSPDGAMRDFKRGIAVLVKRARCPVLPAAVEGVHDAWPRGRKFPCLLGRRIALCYAEPIPHAELMDAGADAALERLQAEIESMRLILRANLRSQTGGRYPPPGPADEPFTPSTDQSNPQPK